MLAETDLKKLFHKINRQFSAKLHFFGSDVTVNFYDHASKMQLSTPVYLGGSYIPKSVRQCIKQPQQQRSIRTSFSIDEDNYRILLTYNGALSLEEDYLFEGIVEEFCAIAEEWRTLLDEKDKNDLVYVHAR